MHAKKSPGSAKVQHSQISSDALPRASLEDAIPVAGALHSEYAGRDAALPEVASVLKLSYKGATFKYQVWAAQAYGLVSKAGNGRIALSETGRKIAAPTYDGEDAEAKVKAVMTPTVLSKFFADYNGRPVPSATHLPNILETRFGVPRARTGEAMSLILKNGRYAGIIRDRGPDQPFVELSVTNPSAGGGAGASDQAAPAAEPTAGQVDWRKVCFFITPIGEDGTEVRKHADMMLKHLVEPAAKESGLTVVRADSIARAGMITQQVFEYLAKARLCVADLSFGNPNAFYELGVRHVCQRPTVQIIRKGDKIPFDVSQGRTIQVDTADVYTIMDRVASARRELNEQTGAIMQSNGGAPAEDNPVTLYLPGLSVKVPE